MAQQITIDIVADTKGLTNGVNNATNQINGLSNGLKGIASAASAAASAFLLKEGVTFLKQGIDEAKEAQETMRAATATFGEGSAALKKITEDATKFGKEIAVDNDTILKLSVQLGSRLPEDSKALSAELVNLAFDVQAFTGGALDAETVTNKLAKALADGELKASDLEKIVPGLTKAQYDQAAAASKAGDNQKALTIIIDAAQKKYGDAAEKNVTATQKFDTALADLKEQVGTQVLPIVEKFIDGLTTLLEWFDKQPDSIKKIEIALGILLTAGALTLTFLASMKTSLITLGLVSEGTAGSIGLATIATNLLKIALAGLGIGLVIAAIVLLIQHWDKVTEVVGKVWQAIKDFASNATKAIGDFVSNAIATFKDFLSKVGTFIGDVVSIFFELPGKLLQVGKDLITSIWNGISGSISWLTSKVGSLGSSIASALKGAIGSFVSIGEDILSGLVTGITNKVSSVVNAVKNAVGSVISGAKSLLGIKSPSKVFAKIGKNVTDGFVAGIKGQQYYVKNNLDNFFTDVIPTISPEVFIPNFKDLTVSLIQDAVSNATVDQSQLAGYGIDWNAATEQFDIASNVVTTDMLYGISNSLSSVNTSGLGSPINITINAGLGTDPYTLGREVSDALKKYGTISRNAVV